MANHQDNYTSNFEGQDPAGDAGLSLFLNGGEYSYRPSGSDTTVYIPTVEKHSHDYANIVSAITRVLAAGGSPIITKLGAEFTYANGDASEYKFVNVSGDNITEMTIDRNTGTVTSRNNFLTKPVEVEYSVASASDVASIVSTNGLPYVKVGAVIANLYKIETNKYTFRTTHIRVDDDINYLDVVDYIVDGATWTTVTKTVSSGDSGSAYINTVASDDPFDTTGHSGMHSVLSVDNVPKDGIYQLSVMLHITPKTASATKSDLVFHFTNGDGTGWPDHTFHAVVDDSQTFAQQLSFSTSVSLKAGQNTLRIQCGGLNTEYLVFVDELTIAQLVNGVYHNGDDFADVHTLTEAPGFNNDDGVLVDGATGGPRFMLWQTLANKVFSHQGFHITYNDEYAYAVCDANDVFLFGVKTDGSFEWSKGMSQELRTKLEFIFGSLLFLESNKVDKEYGKSLISQIFANGVSFVENDEYIFAVVDSKGSVLFGNKRKDGDFICGRNSFVDELYKIKVNTEKGKSLITSQFAESSSVEDNDEYDFAVVDTNNSILFGFKKNKTIVNNINKPDVSITVSTVEELKSKSYNVDQVVYTLGYYSIGDGGSGRYIIKESSDYPANGVDKIAVGFGMTACLDFTNGEIYIEQIGGKAFDRSFDNASVIDAAFNANVKNILLRDRIYYTNSAIHAVRGASIIGVQSSSGSNYPSTLWQQNERAVIVCEVYHFRLENVHLVNGLDDAKNNTSCFGLVMRISDESQSNKTISGLILRNCYLYNFYKGIKTQEGSGRVMWNFEIDHCTFSNCSVAFEIYRGFSFDFRNCFWTHNGSNIAFEKSCNLAFTACNFGIIDKCVTMTDYTHHQEQDKSNLIFVGCNFEFDESIAHAVDGAAFDLTVSGHQINIAALSCDFVFTFPQASNVHTFAFSDNTIFRAENCNLIYGENVFYPDSVFNSSRPPKLVDGSLVISHSPGFIPVYADSIKSVADIDGVIQINPSTTLTTHKKGRVLFNTTTNRTCYWDGVNFVNN